MRSTSNYFGAMALLLGFLIFFVHADEEARIVDKDKRFIVTELGRAGTINVVSFAPECEQLIVAGYDPNPDFEQQFITFWRFEKPVSHVKYKCRTAEGIGKIAISPSGKYVAFGSLGGYVCIMTRDGKEVNVFRHFERTSTGIEYLTFVDEEHVFSLSTSGIGQKWNIVTNRTATYNFMPRILVQCGAGTSSTRDLAWCDSEAIYFEKESKVWGKILLSRGHGISRLSFSNDAKHLIAVEGKKILIFNIKEKKLMKEWVGHDEGMIYAVAADPTRHLFVTAGLGGVVRIWDYTGKLHRAIRRYDSTVFSVAISHDGKLLATGGEQQKPVIWNLVALLKSD